MKFTKLTLTVALSVALNASQAQSNNHRNLITVGNPAAGSMEASTVTRCRYSVTELSQPSVNTTIEYVREELVLLGSVSFQTGAIRLGNEAVRVLNKVYSQMKTDLKLRIQLRGYAGDPNLDSFVAQRLSRDRAMAVRKYLIECGARSTRIDVRALGNRSYDGAPRRVDIHSLKLRQF